MSTDLDWRDQAALARALAADRAELEGIPFKSALREALAHTPGLLERVMAALAEMRQGDSQAQTDRRRSLRIRDTMEPVDWQTENGPAEGGIVIETRPVTNDAGRIVATPSLAVNKATHPLEHYEARGILDEVQTAAGKRFRSDYELGGLGPRVTVNLMASGGGDAMPSLTATDRQLSARSRFRDAYCALAGKTDKSRLAACALAVCCDGRSAADFAAGEGRKIGNNHRVEGITRLRVALDALAAHYGLT